MENASKALLMAAAVLLGIMIISVGVAIFNTLSSFSQTTIARMQERQVAEFNSNFTKYYGQVDGEAIQVTIHDIISAANFAKQSNIDNELQGETGYSEYTNYVQVDVKIGGSTITKLEKQDVSTYQTLIQNNSLVADENGKLAQTKYFVCTNLLYSEQTGRVMYIALTVN